MGFQASGEALSDADNLVTPMARAQHDKAPLRAGEDEGSMCGCEYYKCQSLQLS